MVEKKFNIDAKRCFLSIESRWRYFFWPKDYLKETTHILF